MSRDKTLRESMTVLTPSDAYEIFPEAFDDYTDDMSNIELLYMFQMADYRGGERMFVFQMTNGDIMNVSTGEVYDSLLEVIADYFEFKKLDYVVFE